MALLGAMIAIVVLGRGDAMAQEESKKPISLGLWNPIQIAKEDQSIGGFRFSLIYGKNANMTGLDLGLINATTGSVKGVQWGLVGMTGGDFTGIALNAVNLVTGEAKGVSFGWYNQAGHGNGVMIGLVNQAQTMNGLQIGLINIIKQGGAFPVFPIVNWTF